MRSTIGHPKKGRSSRTSIGERSPADSYTTWMNQGAMTASRVATASDREAYRQRARHEELIEKFEEPNVAAMSSDRLSGGSDEALHWAKLNP